MSTVQISAADVNKLRQQTGAGMMDCKKALVEANGDFDAAVDYLRKKGAKVAASRSDRESNEGVVIAKTTADGKRGIIVEVNCETDFVAKNTDFIAFATSIADLAIANNPASIEALTELELNGTKLADQILDQTGKIGEKIGVSKYEVISGEKVVAYIHGNYRLGVLVSLSAKVADADEAGKDVAMQIAAMNPLAVDETSIPADVIARISSLSNRTSAETSDPREFSSIFAALIPIPPRPCKRYSSIGVFLP